MERFTTLTARAAPLGLANVDTDQLIPARFMKRSRADGYGGFLLHDVRRDTAGRAVPGFVLDNPRYAEAKMLVARRNFGTGSSREAAVYALWDAGIRCVIAPSFGDIFASNATKNGLLPAVVREEDAEALLAWLAASDDATLTVDLDQQVIRAGNAQFAIAIDPVRRTRLLNGWDDVDLTRAHAAEIASYRARRAVQEPWAVAVPEH